MFDACFERFSGTANCDWVNRKSAFWCCVVVPFVSRLKSYACSWRWSLSGNGEEASIKELREWWDRLWGRTALVCSNWAVASCKWVFKRKVYAFGAGSNVFDNCRAFRIGAFCGMVGWTVIMIVSYLRSVRWIVAPSSSSSFAKYPHAVGNRGDSSKHF